MKLDSAKPITILNSIPICWVREIGFLRLAVSSPNKKTPFLRADMATAGQLIGFFFNEQKECAIEAGRASTNLDFILDFLRVRDRRMRSARFSRNFRFIFGDGAVLF